ncbi:MAG: hypothetical protein WAV20_07280, partial [Blastocatellia bacterium]
FLSLSCFFPATSDPFQRCLPSGIKLSNVVSARLTRSNATGASVERVTVEEKLIQLKARCRKGRLVDLGGKQIRFYRLIGCWGNPPADYREMREHQRTELEKLKKRYTVIEMTCNPDGDVRRIQ